MSSSSAFSSFVPCAAAHPDLHSFPTRRSSDLGLVYMIFINALAAVLLFTLAEPIVRLLFERGRFTAVSTHNASLAVLCLAPGLVAFSMVNILARAFYALGDTRTPMRISVACFAINLLVV